jgi:hypothetical protein
LWQSSSEVHCMFAGATGDFQHRSLRRQNPAQNSEDRIAVAHHRWRRLCPLKQWLSHADLDAEQEPEIRMIHRLLH